MNLEIKLTIESLIGKGSAEDAIEFFRDNVKNPRLQNELLILLSQYRTSNKEYLNGQLSREDFSVTTNRLNAAIIYSLNDIFGEKKLITDNSIQKEKVELWVSELKFRESVRNFNENGHEELKQSVKELIEYLTKELNELSKSYSDTIKFEIDDSNKSKFEFYLIWKNPVNETSRTLLLDFTDDNNSRVASKFNDFKIPSSRLNLITYNKEVRPHSLSFSNHYRQKGEYYYPTLNENCEICWKNKDQILSTDELVNRFIQIFIKNYDKESHPTNQIAWLPRQRGRSTKRSSRVRQINSFR